MIMYSYGEAVKLCCQKDIKAGRLDQFIEQILMNIPFTKSSRAEAILRAVAKRSGRIAASWNRLFGVNMRWFCTTACNEKQICECARQLTTNEKAKEFDQFQTTLVSIYNMEFPVGDGNEWFARTMDLNGTIEWPD